MRRLALAAVAFGVAGASCTAVLGLGGDKSFEGSGGAGGAATQSSSSNARASSSAASPETSSTEASTGGASSSTSTASTSVATSGPGGGTEADGGTSSSSGTGGAGPCDVGVGAAMCTGQCVIAPCGFLGAVLTANPTCQTNCGAWVPYSGTELDSPMGGLGNCSCTCQADCSTASVDLYSNTDTLCQVPTGENVTPTCSMISMGLLRANLSSGPVACMPENVVYDMPVQSSSITLFLAQPTDCPQGSTCIPNAPIPQPPTPCLAIEADDATCPMGYPNKTRFSTSDFHDGRSCGCQCGDLNDPAQCVAAIASSDASCSDPYPTPYSSCVAFDSFGNAELQTPAFAPTCTSADGPAGGVITANGDAWTVCCS